MTPKEYTFDAAYQPQVRAKRGTREIMLDVIIALLPALCVGVWQFGAQALIPLAVSIVSCVFFEWAYRKLMKKPDSIGGCRSSARSSPSWSSSSSTAASARTS